MRPRRARSSLLTAVAACLGIAGFAVAGVLAAGREKPRPSTPAQGGGSPTSTVTLPAVPLVAGPVAPAGQTPVVRVAGNQLVDGTGRPIRLLGVNRSGAEYACVQGWGIFEGPTDDSSVRAIASWHANAVRIPLNEHCWLGINGVKAKLAGAAYQNAVSAYVEAINRAGLVAVLDLHWSAPGNQRADRTQRMPDADHSPDFWRSVASRFLERPGVMFDLFNEPRGVDWKCWRDGCTMPGGWQAAGMQSLVDAVRSTGATQPIIASGLAYGNDLSSWLEYRPVDPASGTTAGFHVYNFNECDDVRCWDRTVAPVAAVVPVVTTEAGQDDCRDDFITSYMRWADARGVSYLGWTWNTWDCREGPALISSYDGQPTGFGAGLRRHLASLVATASGTG